MSEVPLTVVLPVREEASRVIGGIQRLIAQVQGLDWELVLIDLGSRDGSAELLEPFDGYGNVKLLFEEEPLGKGYGHRLGTLVAAGDAVLLADLALPLDNVDLTPALEALQRDPLVLFSPMHPESTPLPRIERVWSRAMRRAFDGGERPPPSAPDRSVVLIRRDRAQRLYTVLKGAGPLHRYELVQQAVLEGATFAECPVDARGWVRPRALRLPLRYLAARRATRTLRSAVGCIPTLP